MLVAATRGQAQTLINGGFESPATTTSYAGGGDGWTTTGDATVENNASINYGKTPYGNQLLRLEGMVSVGGAQRFPATASQTISSGFNLGSTYELTLAAASASGQYFSVFGVTISGGATASLSVTLPAQGLTPPVVAPFANYSLNFTVTSSNPVTITFTDNNNATGSLVDNVNLVPEPSAWAALLVGTVVLVGLLRCRGCCHA